MTTTELLSSIWTACGSDITTQLGTCVIAFALGHVVAKPVLARLFRI